MVDTLTPDRDDAARDAAQAAWRADINADEWCDPDGALDASFDAGWAAARELYEPAPGVQDLIAALSYYGPVPHQPGCSGEYAPALEKCGAVELNAALARFWEGKDE